MYTTAHKDYINLTQFSAISRMFEKLKLQEDAVTVLDADAWKKLTLREAFRRLSVGLWVALLTLVVGAFSLGYGSHDYLPQKSPPAQTPK